MADKGEEVMDEEEGWRNDGYNNTKTTGSVDIDIRHHLPYFALLSNLLESL